MVKVRRVLLLGNGLNRSHPKSGNQYKPVTLLENIFGKHFDINSKQIPFPLLFETFFNLTVQQDNIKFKDLEKRVFKKYTFTQKGVFYYEN